MKHRCFLATVLISIAGVFISGCGIEEPLERVQKEPKPYTKELPAAYRQIRLGGSNSAQVLNIIKKYNSELVSQSESVIASWGEKKNTSQFWLTMTAFDEEKFTVTRKYFLAVDEKPWHLFAEGQKLRLDSEMILDEATLSEPYPSENQKRIAVLAKVLENARDDIAQVRQDSRVLNEGGAMMNQTLERVLYILKESPALAEKLNKKDGLNFDHLTLGKGRIQMVVRGKIVTIKIRIGNLKKIWDEK